VRVDIEGSERRTIFKRSMGRIQQGSKKQVINERCSELIIKSTHKLLSDELIIVEAVVIR
jgi:hypothetical protein